MLPANVLKREDWQPEHYAMMEKNAKARQHILVGLTRTAIDKVTSIKIAKEMWAVVITNHRESDDMKDHRKYLLLREFHAFKMNDGENVSDYQSRFTILVDKLSASGVKIDNWEQSLQVIYGMSEKYEFTRRVALMSSETKTLPVADIFGKFYDQEITDNQKAIVAKEA